MSDFLPAATSRRRFLRAAGLGVALPSLAAFTPQAALANETAGPLRMVYLYVPNGVNMAHWRPQGEGTNFQFNDSTKSLEAHRDHIQFVSNLENREAYVYRDGAGDHARANASFLTAARPHKSAVDVRCGISADQVVSQQVGHLTRLPSLELSCDGVRKSGACDSGYSCAYQYNLSWRDELTPIAPESNPRLVFERLFGAGSHGQRSQNFQMRQARQKSVLDFVRDEAKMMERQIGREDRLKLDEYLTGVRSIEERIEKTETYGTPPDPNVETPPEQVPGSYREHMRLMFDVLALALETDQTRVASFMLAHDGSNRSFLDIDLTDAHHNLSHHQKKKDRLEKLARIDTFYCEQFAYFLQQMKDRKSASGRSLLDDSMIVYGSGLSDGDRHNQDDLPIILAGGGAGTLTPGRHLKFEKPTPMANLHLAMIHRMGAQAERFSDSDAAMKI